jgi:hypothetical protein
VGDLRRQQTCVPSKTPQARCLYTLLIIAGECLRTSKNTAGMMPVHSCLSNQWTLFGTKNNHLETNNKHSKNRKDL